MRLPLTLGIELMTPLPPPPPLRSGKAELQVLRHALAILSDHRRWHQRQMFRYEDPMRAGPDGPLPIACCLVGAVRFCSRKLAPDKHLPLEQRTLRRLVHTLSTHPFYTQTFLKTDLDPIVALTRWNDANARTISDIRSVLRLSLSPKYAPPPEP